MEELLILVIQVLVEGIGSLPWDLWTYKWDDDRSEIAICFAAVVVGGCIGGLSLFLIPDTLLRSSVSRVLNLMFAPLLSGCIAWLIAKKRQESDAEVSPASHFWRSFSFTLGLTAIRFAYADRPVA